MANEQIIQQGLIVGRAANAAITIVPTVDSIGKISFDDRNSDQVAEIVFDHNTNIFKVTIDSVVQIQASSTDVIIAGNLTVTGTTITTTATDLAITDNIIILNDGEAGAGVTLGASGIEIDRGSSANTIWQFNETNDWWEPAGAAAFKKLGNIASIDSTTVTEQVLTIVSTGAIIPPSGTAAAQPATPSGGMLRYNSDITSLEVYDGTGWAKILATGGIASPTIIGTVNLNNNSVINPLDPVDDTGVGDRGYNDIRYLNAASNLSDVTNTVTARSNLGITANSVDAIFRGGDTTYGVLTIGDGGTLDIDYTSIAVAGTGYAVDDTITLSGGTFTVALVLRVTAVGGSGDITTLVQETKGIYTVAPASPAATTTSGSGINATVNNTNTTPDISILPDVDYVGAAVPKDIGQSDGVDGKTGNFRFRAMHAENFHGVATSALYADLAERYEADDIYEPGTVLVYGGEAEVTITNIYADTRVAGVVSTNPAFMMNSRAGESDTHPYIALKGKVPCKVIGPIKKGDLLVTSATFGYAISADSSNVLPYTAFARANENFDGENGVINASVI